jgi:hypothetical protein
LLEAGTTIKEEKKHVEIKTGKENETGHVE